MCTNPRYLRDIGQNCLSHLQCMSGFCSITRKVCQLPPPNAEDSNIPEVCCPIVPADEHLARVESVCHCGAQGCRYLNTVDADTNAKTYWGTDLWNSEICNCNADFLSRVADGSWLGSEADRQYCDWLRPPVVGANGGNSYATGATRPLEFKYCQGLEQKFSPQLFLEMHNMDRRCHNVPELKWDPELARLATIFSNMATSGVPARVGSESRDLPHSTNEWRYENYGEWGVLYDRLRDGGGVTAGVQHSFIGENIVQTTNAPMEICGHTYRTGMYEAEYECLENLSRADATEAIISFL